jgi:hypothetical protein
LPPTISPCLHFGQKSIPRERRRTGNRGDRLLAFLDAIHEAALAGLKEHDRLVLAKNQMARRLRDRRASSKLPDLVELVLERPLVSTGDPGGAKGLQAEGRSTSSASSACAR